jgi:hypothetical protein
MTAPDLEVSLRVGTIGVSFQTATPVQKREISSFFGPFLADPQPSFWRIALRPGRARLRRPTPLVRRSDGGYDVRWSRFSGRILAGSRSGELRITSSAVLGTFLRAFMSQILANESGFLLHSAGAKVRGGACVLAGVSGSGKSTISRLGAPGRMLSDEIVLVQKRGGGWKAFGTPFNGELEISNAGGAALRALYFLEKSGRWGKRLLPRQEAARRTLRCVLNFSDDPSAHRGILDAAADLVSSVPAYALSFAKTLPREATLEQILSI